MYNVIRWYNQNRKKIWVTIISGTIIILIIYRILYMYEDSKKISQTTNENRSTEQLDTNTLNSISIESQKSAITGNEKYISNDEISVVDKFISYCNSKQIEQAYNLISDECKEEMYSTINIFYTTYYNPIFGKTKINADVENWVGDIYKLSYYEDALSTGKLSSENNKNDYITIIKDSNGNYKLNINGYIRRTSLNVVNELNNVSIKVVQKDTYMDYEYYTFEITNNSEKNIGLSRVNQSEDMYLVDKNKLKYYSAINELAQEELVIYPKQTKKVKIKFNNKYSSTREIRAIAFENIVMDYNEYKNLENSYSNFSSLKISI